MKFRYFAYGIPIHSDIELPALYNSDFSLEQKTVNVRIENVPEQLNNPALIEKPFTLMNTNEWLYRFPEVANYYVKDGTEVIIEPLTDNREEVLIYFYANCLAAVLYQRNIIPFHVSGIILPTNKVVLFAAPSRTGKSTTAIKLLERGYKVFTDDTAIFEIEDGIAYVTASYPMVRLWQNTIDIQNHYEETSKQLIFAEIDKYGFNFHEEFVPNKVQVAGIVFLEESGNDLSIQNISNAKCMQLLGQNMYRGQWITGMQKQRLQFEMLSTLAQSIPAYKAIRPKGTPTFEAFAESIDLQILRAL